MQPETAVAVREDQHPIIAQLDARMPEIAAILPDGMRIERFRKVVVQAMLRNRDLWDCSPISLITAITEAAEVGIEPTGVLGKGWLIPYKGEAKFIPGWRGFVDLCWRADRLLLTPELVRTGDEFAYRRGTGQYLHHVPVLDDPERERDESNVTFAYVIVRFPDGREDFDVMSRASLDRIRTAALAKTPEHKRDKAIWNLHPGEMMKKTPIRRIAKRLPLSPAVQAMLARDEEIDFDTPVERVADPKRDGLRDRIASRTAALRGESIGESSSADEAVPEGPGDEPGITRDTTAPSGGSPKGDPWMRRLHAVGNERGMDHDALHDWAVEHFGVASLNDLDTHQRATFMQLVERMEVMPTSTPASAHAGGSAPGVADSSVSAAPDSDVASESLDPSDAATSAAQATRRPGSPESPAAPTDEELLAAAGPGAEIVPPKPGSPEYKALPSGRERAAAKAWHDAHKAEPDR